MFYNGEVVRVREDVSTLTVNQSIDINDIFFGQIEKLLSDGDRVLDVGTGNGFVLKRLIEINPTLALFGVDNSMAMVREASQNLPDQKILLASNSALPFASAWFNMVTAKNVTAIDAGEIYRVLQPGGTCVFREYGEGKGMMEIAQMFPDRLIRSRPSEYYERLFIGAGFMRVELRKYRFTRQYETAADLIKIVKSFPFIADFSPVDEQRILENFRDYATITSDPFILIAYKSKEKLKCEK